MQTSNWGKRHYAGLALAGFGVLGAFLPWAKVLFVTANGTDGDGIITLLLSVGFAGVIAANAMWRLDLRLTAIACLALGGAIAGVGIYDWNNLSSVGNSSPSGGINLDIHVQVGTGLVMTAVTGVLMVAYSLFLGYRGLNKPVNAEQAPELVAVGLVIARAPDATGTVVTVPVAESLIASSAPAASTLSNAAEALYETPVVSGPPAPQKSRRLLIGGLIIGGVVGLCVVLVLAALALFAGGNSSADVQAAVVSPAESARPTPAPTKLRPQVVKEIIPPGLESNVVVVQALSGCRSGLNGGRRDIFSKLPALEEVRTEVETLLDNVCVRAIKLGYDGATQAQIDIAATDECTQSLCYANGNRVTISNQEG